MRVVTGFQTGFSSPSFRNIISKIKKDGKSSWVTPIFSATIPGFGVFSVGIIALPLIIKGIWGTFEKGLNPKKIHPIDPKVQCYQNHPGALHKHTITADNYPFKKKIKLADGFNSLLNSFTDAFELYNEQKELFYSTLNQEMSECTADYYRLLSKDAAREAWVQAKYEQNPQKGLKIVEETLAKLKLAKDHSFKKPKKELLLVKALLLDQTGQHEQARFVRGQAVDLAVCSPMSPEQRKVILKTLFSIGFEDRFVDLAKVDGFDLMLIDSKKMLQEYEVCSFKLEKCEELLLKERFIKAVLDNLSLLVKNNALDQLGLSKEIQSHFKEASYFSLKLLKLLYLEFQTFVPDIPSADQLLFIENAALMDAYLNAYLKSQKSAKVKKNYQALLAERNNATICHFKKGEKEERNKRVILVDTFSSSVKEAEALASRVSSSLKGQKIESLYYRMPKIYQIVDQIDNSALKGKIQEVCFDIFQEKKEALILCYQRGESLLLSSMKGVPKESKENFKIVVASPVSARGPSSSISYFLNSQDRLSQLFLNLNESRRMLQTVSTRVLGKDSFKEQYLNKFINLISEFIN